jgi:hypothetical protein
VTFALARSLLHADAVTPTALAEALFLSATRGTSLVRTLLAARAIDSARLEQMLERGDAPFMHHIAPVTTLVERLPQGLCDRLLAIPVRRDPRTGTVDVAVVDARDPHPAEEIGHWLKAPVRLVRTSIASMEAALLRLGDRPDPEADPGMHALAPPIWAPPPAPIPGHLLRTPLYGTRAYVPAEAAPAEGEPGADESDMAIPLTRRNFGGEPVIELGRPAKPPANEVIELRRPAGDPVLDLKRRKPSAPQLENPPSSASLPRLGDDPGPPSTARGPFPYVPSASTKQTAATPEAVLRHMGEANDRDWILELLIAGTKTVAVRAAVLAVRRDGLTGWTCSPETADRKNFRAVVLPNMMPSVFHTALERDGARLVRVPMDAAHAPFIAALRTAPVGHALAAAVQAEGKPVAVVFADGLADPVAAVERVAALARAAGEAFSRLLRDRRSERLK